MNNKQITVQFHVDDLKVSHKDQAVLKDFLNELRRKFGQEDEMTENKGLVHKYVGKIITIDYSITGKVVFTIFNYINDMIVEAAEDPKNSCSYYPRNDQLFEVDDDSPRLLQKDSDILHCYVTRLLFARKRARPNM